ncbi:MAG: polymerase subunit delta [Acidimicrobiia bacterium]|nr:polymerase subunit delta [Acidimicrobiia bacterium]
MSDATIEQFVEHANALDAVRGQDAAVRELHGALRNPVHAYLFVGPRGSGKRAAARAFAAELLADGATGEAAARHRRLALAETHPDLEVVEREGPFITREQARRIVERSVRSPVEGSRKVLLLTEFHLVLDAAPLLLKAIEEPPPSTIFVVLADEMPPELVTIASRCVVVRFASLTSEDLIAELVEEGIDPAQAARAAEAAGGDLARARVLVTDPGLEERVGTWRRIPDRLDGTGTAVATLVDELTGQLERALGPMEVRQQEELADMAARAERYGMTKGSQKSVEDRHRRERRRFRTDELRFGLGVLSRAYRDRLVDAVASGQALGSDVVNPFEAIAAAVLALERNPNEALLLQALLVRLHPLR